MVGITNGWTQILFKPLHDSIYTYLSTLSGDGTNDQLKPVKLLLSQKAQQWVSVDLSNATDRLPVETQARILNELGLPGSEWREVLRVPYWYRDKPYNYMVGQPMGAYSSFAMLALTQHVLIHLARVNAVKSVKGKLKLPKYFYAILGDDTVVHPAIAKEYVSLLQKLGVKVNPVKGFNGNIIEFAKNLIYYKGDNLSPIGGKVLLRSMREPLFLVPLFKDIENKGLLPILELGLSDFKRLLTRMYGHMILPSRLAWLFTVLGPQSGLWSSQGSTVITSKVLVNYWIGLFQEFIDQEGIKLERIAIKYNNILTRRSNVFLRSFLDLVNHFMRVINFMTLPKIWNIIKMLNHMKGSPILWAALTTASTMPIVLPYIISKFIISGIRILCLVILTKIAGSRGISRSMIKAFTENGLFKIIINLVFPYNLFEDAEIARLREMGLHQQYSDYGSRNPLFTHPWAKWPWKSDVTWFHVFMKEWSFIIPIQLVTDRLQNTRRGISISDQLPALKTAKLVISSGTPVFGQYFRKLDNIAILQYKIKQLERRLKSSKSKN